MRRLALVLIVAACALGARAELPFIEDDHAKAVSRAKAKGLPLFVETWAPWCHTCRSMKAFVYPDKSLERYADRFVWLSINTEDPKNAEFLKKYPIPALPTILLLDAKGAVLMHYTGGATVPQLRKLLDESPKPEAESDKVLVTADRLASEGKHAEAVKSYEGAIAGAPAKWPKFGRAAESLVFSLSLTQEHERCATRATELYPRVKGTASAANVAATGLACAVSVGEEHAKRNELIKSLEDATLEALGDANVPISDDDRSSMYMALIDARAAMKDEQGKKNLQYQWVAMLELAAKNAQTPAQRMVYDSHLLTAYLVMGKPQYAVEMLLTSERDAPDDYNPPARLAIAYKELKQYDQALAASDRALAKVYGPRKVIVLMARADIYLAKGEISAAKEVIARAVDFAKSLPPGQRNEARIESLEKRLAAMR